MAKLDPAVAEHIHFDEAVDEERVARFLDASSALRMRVLAELRRRVGTDQSSGELAVVGLAIALVVALMPSTPAAALDGAEWWQRLTGGFIAGVLGVIVLLPMLTRYIVNSVRRDRAIVWLAAFEDAIEHERVPKQCHQSLRIWLERRRSRRTTR